jgi:predicted transcriptional regulator of viral defense system
MARRQHGVLTRRDLLALGFTTDAIKHRIATGRLHLVRRGVYAVGRSELTREGRWMAAVLASGDDTILSHGSAAALWGIGPEWRLIEISVRHRVWSRLSGVKGRARPALPDDDVTVHRGIPVTTVSRTILDQAATPISDAELERLFRPLAIAAGLPQPLIKAIVNGYEVDFDWPT